MNQTWNINKSAQLKFGEQSLFSRSIESEIGGIPQLISLHSVARLVRDALKSQIFRRLVKSLWTPSPHPFTLKWSHLSTSKSAHFLCTFARDLKWVVIECKIDPRKPRWRRRKIDRIILIISTFSLQKPSEILLSEVKAELCNLVKKKIRIDWLWTLFFPVCKKL